MSNTIERFSIMPDDAFAALGGGQIAYLRPMTAQQLKALVPNAPALEPGHPLWGLVNADGTPILIADSREAALAGANEHALTMVSVH